MIAIIIAMHCNNLQNHGETFGANHKIARIVFRVLARIPISGVVHMDFCQIHLTRSVFLVP